MSFKIKSGDREFEIFPSERKGKKYKVNIDGEWIHFGAKGYSMFPGKKRGDNYCTRSSGIKTKKYSPNYFSRALWGCDGTESRKVKRWKN